ncbi:MAG TPA: hypothetical protein VF760_00615 [Xanthobacteraceae bacterium]
MLQRSETRRGLLGLAGCLLIAAPAIVHPQTLMSISGERTIIRGRGPFCLVGHNFDGRRVAEFLPEMTYSRTQFVSIEAALGFTDAERHIDDEVRWINQYLANLKPEGSILACDDAAPWQPRDPEPTPWWRDFDPPPQVIPNGWQQSIPFK